jgi:Flp pilus assembly protein TadG
MNIPHVNHSGPERLRRREMRRSEEGASAVEFAIIAPLLFMLLFGIIGFGLAFLQVQSIRTAVREGGRVVATGYDIPSTQQRVVEAATGAIPPNLKSNISVHADGSTGPTPCHVNNIGSNVTVSFPTSSLSGGGVTVHIPLLPDIVMSPVITASFRCEV